MIQWRGTRACSVGTRACSVGTRACSVGTRPAASALVPAASALVPTCLSTLCHIRAQVSRRVSTRQARVPAPQSAGGVREMRVSPMKRLPRASTRMSAGAERTTALAADTSTVSPTLAQHRNLGRAFYENPTTQAEAVVEFKKALDLAPNSVREKLNYGLALLRAGRTQEGVAQLKDVQRRDPKLPHTWFNLGIQYKKTGDTKRGGGAVRTHDPACAG